MSWKNILLFVGGTVLVMGLAVMLLWQFGTQSGKPIAEVAGDGRWQKGQGKVQIVEFSDFQCPACKSVQPALAELLKKNEGKVVLVYRHLPLSSIHPYAQAAAQAAEAAGKQGKFFEMHDLLFVRQEEWSKQDPKIKFETYAKEIGLDLVKYQQDYQSQEVSEKIGKDVIDATKYRVGGTPTFFVDGVETRFDQIQARIDAVNQ